MPNPFQPDTLAFIVLLGLIAGTLGGMLGVGGSVVMIPGLAMLFGTGENQHLYQASAMAVNVAVAIPATLRHRQARMMVPAVIRWMLPLSLVTIVMGVWASNLPIFKDEQGGLWLGRVLAMFLVYVIVLNIRKLIRSQAQIEADRSQDALITPMRSGLVGAVMGSTGGLLGIGGGGLAVPLQQTLIKLPLRNAIANSAFVMVFSAILGAAYKIATLDGHHYDDVVLARPAWQTALLLAAVLAPTAILGARLGAKLTHTLPLNQVRIAFVLMMIVAAWKMAALPI